MRQKVNLKKYKLTFETASFEMMNLVCALDDAIKNGTRGIF